MTMKFLKEAVYSEKYKTKEGEEKTKYINIGALFEREDGSLCAKILGSWVNFYDKKPKPEDDKHSNSDFAKSSKHLEDKKNGYQSEDDLDDLMPF
ncbi:MAG: hypothetical protein ACRC5T_11060 [Cetobacterium sp.]